MRALWLAVAVLAFCVAKADSQQIADHQADVGVPAPAFASKSGPVIGVDSAHHNFHTIDGRYAPFAGLLSSDGFRVVDSNRAFSPQSLTPIKVLVVANALPPDLVDNWRLPAHSAFAPTEIAALKTWVGNGGSLLLIADHLPFAGSARDLAQAFGFAFQDGVVERDPMDGRADMFTLTDRSLRDDVVTRGRNAREVVTAVRTFTGSAFKAPAGARPILVLPAGFMIHDCGLPCPARVAEHDAGGYLQGAVMSAGKGRIAVFGEEAMFSAQIIPLRNGPFYFGFNAPGAEQNKQFILNLLRWLSGVLRP